MKQDNSSVFDLLVGYCERAVAEGHFKPGSWTASFTSE